MIYLDNTARPQLKSDLVAHYQSQPIANALTLAKLPPPWPDENPANTPKTLKAALTAAR